MDEMDTLKIYYRYESRNRKVFRYIKVRFVYANVCFRKLLNLLTIEYYLLKFKIYYHLTRSKINRKGKCLLLNPFLRLFNENEL
jgi:hypothetical protein